MHGSSPTIDFPARRAFGGPSSWLNLPRRARWRHGSGCSWSLPDFPGHRLRSGCTTTPVDSLLGRISTTRTCRLGIEYDGSTHRETMTADNRRQNRVINAGHRLLRFSAADVLSCLESVVLVV